ncbi:MAG: hypothetical protein LC781_16660 [Actinobacteria bacterium]|nr:hypothetical protein [Actinomycetota bacterium]
MKRVAAVLAVATLLVTLVAGVAVAATFQCTTLPCFGTNQADVITERQGNGVDDEIRALDGADIIDARNFTNDEDRLYGGAGNDRILADDGDNQDFINCGSGKKDVAVADKGDNVSKKTCETVRRK